MIETAKLRISVYAHGCDWEVECAKVTDSIGTGRVLIVDAPNDIRRRLNGKRQSIVAVVLNEDTEREWYVFAATCTPIEVGESLRFEERDA